MICFKNVHFEINTNSILRGVDLKIEEKDMVIIYFEREAGASTIAKLACGLLCPSKGEVEVFGKHPTPKTVNASLLISEPALLNRKSALKNICFALKQYGEKLQTEQVFIFLKQYGMNASIKPKRMSLKEKILLQIARAKILNKKIIIADDIFRDIDDEGVKEIMPYFLDLIKDKTALIFSSNTTFELKDATEKYLNFGRLYDFVEPCPILQIEKMMHPERVYVLGVFKQDKILTEKGNIKANNLSKRLEDGDEVVVSMQNGKMCNIFDGIDFERIL